MRRLERWRVTGTVLAQDRPPVQTRPGYHWGLESDAHTADQILPHFTHINTSKYIQQVPLYFVAT
jgi:hypothetical protein